MAKVLDTSDFIDGKKSLPFEGFFVDTNVIIAYSDPFSNSNSNAQVRNDNEKITEFFNRPGSSGYKGYSTLFSLMEYYNYLQRNFYIAIAQDKIYTPEKFKTLRNKDQTFRNIWDGHISKMKKLFKKSFPLYMDNKTDATVLDSYDYTISEIGDHLLYKLVMNSEGDMKSIYTLDQDYYSFSDDLTILTSNQNLINKAKSDGKLL